MQLSTEKEEFATGLPTHLCSVAIPHTDVEILTIEQLNCVAVLEKEVPFVEMGTLDQQTEVKIVFMLAMDKVDDQLKLLQQLMQIFQNEEKIGADSTNERRNNFSNTNQ